MAHAYIIASTRAKKSFLVLTCGAPSLATALPKAKGEDGESCSDGSSDDEDGTVSWLFYLLLHSFCTSCPSLQLYILTI